MNQPANAELGRLISQHRGTFRSGGWFWYLGAIAIAAGVLSITQLLGLNIAPAKPNAASPTWTMAGLAIGVGVILLLAPVTRWKQRVDVFEHGLIWQRFLGAVRVTRNQVRDVEFIQHHDRMSSVAEVILHLDSGRELSMSGLSQPDQLTNLLRAFARPPQPAPSAPAAQAWSPPGAPGGGWRPPRT